MPRTILLIDSHPPSIDRGRAVLETAGFQVEIASQGASGIEAFGRLLPHLTLVGDSLPDRSAREVCLELRNTTHGRRTPILLIVGSRGDRDRHAGKWFGCDASVTRPISGKVLLTTVQTFLSKPPKSVPVSTVEDVEPGVAKSAEEGAAAAGRPMTGALEHLALAEIVQTLSLGGKTARVTLRDGMLQGWVWFEAGVPRHAVAGVLTGELAVYELVRWRKGEFVIEHDVHTEEKTLEQDGMYLVMEGLRRMDESEVEECRDERPAPLPSPAGSSEAARERIPVPVAVERKVPARTVARQVSRRGAAPWLWGAIAAVMLVVAAGVYQVARSSPDGASPGAGAPVQREADGANADRTFYSIYELSSPLDLAPFPPDADESLTEGQRAMVARFRALELSPEARAAPEAKPDAGRDAPKKDGPGRVPDPPPGEARTAAPAGAAETAEAGLPNGATTLDVPVAEEILASESTFLSLAVRSNVRTGTVTLLVDGSEVYSRELSAEGKQIKRFFRRMVGRQAESFQAEIEIPPGEHDIVARVATQDGAGEWEDRLAVNLEPGSRRRLQLVAAPQRDRPVTLKLK